jgi:DNA-binding XRE family transcriptional regulator
MEIKDKLKKARLIKGLTQLQLSELAGAAQATINKLESGQIKNPSFELAVKIANILETNVFEIFSNDTINNESKKEFSNIPKELKNKVLESIETGIDFYINNEKLRYNFDNKEDIEKFNFIYNIVDELRINIQSGLIINGFCSAEEIHDFYTNNHVWSKREILRLYGIEKPVK